MNEICDGEAQRVKAERQLARSWIVLIDLMTWSVDDKIGIGT